MDVDPRVGIGGRRAHFFFIFRLEAKFNILKNVMIRILSGDACMMHG